MHDEMDILKEVGNIAAAHGSIALSEIFKRKIELAVPHTTIINIKTIHTEMNLTTGIAVFSTIITGFAGKVIFLLDEKNAFKLNDMSYKLRPEDKRAGILTELGMSLIKEIGNMVTSAYVTALGNMFKRIVLLSPPTLISGMIDEILSITIFPLMEENSFLLIEAVFLEPEEGLKGSFYLVLTPEAAREIKQLCKKMLLEFGAQNIDGILEFLAEELWVKFNRLLTDAGVTVKEGIFRANMEVEIINYSPVTVWLDPKH